MFLDKQNKNKHTKPLDQCPVFILNEGPYVSLSLPLSPIMFPLSAHLSSVRDNSPHLFFFSSHPHLLGCIHSQLLTLFPISLRKQKHSKENCHISPSPCVSTKLIWYPDSAFSPATANLSICPRESAPRTFSHTALQQLSLLHCSASHFLHPCKYVKICPISNKHQKSFSL